MKTTKYPLIAVVAIAVLTAFVSWMRTERNDTVVTVTTDTTQTSEQSTRSASGTIANAPVEHSALGTPTTVPSRVKRQGPALSKAPPDVESIIRREGYPPTAAPMDMPRFGVVTMVNGIPFTNYAVRVGTNLTDYLVEHFLDGPVVSYPKAETRILPQSVLPVSYWSNAVATVHGLKGGSQ